MTSVESQTARLLDRVKGGDASALSALMDLHRDYLRRLIDFQMEPELRQRVDPSDVVQETHLEVMQRIGDFLLRRPMSFRMWLRLTACQRLGMLRRFHLKAEQRSVFRELELPDDSALDLARQVSGVRPAGILEDQERAAQVRRALAQLNGTDCEILLMRAFEGLSNQEAAEALGIEPSAACKRYGRALIHLREKLVAVGFATDS